MKVTITDREVKESERGYPYIGEKDNGETVWFIKEGEGIVLKSMGDFLVGGYINTSGESEYTPLVNKTITIEV